MITRITFTLLTLSLAILLNAQVVEKDLTMSEGINNALSLELKGSDKKRAENIWKSYTKEYGKMDYSRKTKEYVLLEAFIPAIDSEKPVKIFAKFEEFADMTRGFFWIKMDDHFLNSIDNEVEISGADVFLQDYMVQVQKDVVKDELSDEEKALKDLEKDLSKLEKKNKDLQGDIQKARETIRKAEADIENNLKEQTEKQKEINTQKMKVTEVTQKLNKVGKIK